MAYTITKPCFSNKPEAPSPIPPKKLFPTRKTVAGSRKVWISVPQIDRLTFTFPIVPEVIGDDGNKLIAVKEFAAGLGAYFQAEPHNSHYLKGKVWVQWVTLAMGPRGSVVRFELVPYPTLLLRIECNPRKLQLAGFDTLSKVLGGTFAPFNL